MNNIKNCVPKRCTLGGVEFTTKFVKDVENNDNYTRIKFSSGIINISETVSGQNQCHTQIQNSYFHELSHGILDMMGHFELSNDEKFVQGLGNMIFEFIRSCDWIRIEELKHNNESENTFNLTTHSKFNG